MGYKEALLFILMFAVLEVSALPMDSLRLETKNGNRYIIHKVDQGETLYAIGRRYSVDINQIKAINELDNGQLKIGQLLQIPLLEKVTGTSKPGHNEHIVKTGETLFGISRQYGVSVDQIKTTNGMTNNGLAIGQTLKIPQKSQVLTPDKPEKIKASNARQLHTVKPAETLYSISRMYNVPVSDLKALNNLSSNELAIGQQLIISEEVQGDSSTIVNEDPVATTIPEEVDKEEKPDPEQKVANHDAEDKGQQQMEPLKEDETIIQKPTKFGNTDKKRTNTSGVEQVLEEGFAMKIDNSPKTKKYLALHRTVPIGTIMQVRNQMNNQHIFVRVVGTLPDTGINNNVLIRLTDIAFERLGAIDPKIPVEVSYLP